METLKDRMKQVEREVVTRALETAKCAKAAAADPGLSYDAFRKLANRHGIHLTAFHRQRGFIFGGVYVYLAMALAAAALAAGCYLTGRSDGRKLERSAWTEQQNADLRAANQALDEATKRIRAQEHEAAAKVAAVSTAYQKDLTNANRAKDLALNALRAGTLVLRDPGAPSGPAHADRPAEATACAARPDGGAPGRLSDEAAGFLLSEASRADSVVAQLTACQQVIRADRGG